MSLRSLAALLLLLLAPWIRPSAHGGRERVRVNDHHRAAGRLRDGLLTLHLEARLGMWHPDGDSSPGAEVPAFAEAGKPTEIPGPLIRVPAGTEVALTVRNAVPNAVLIVHGLPPSPLTPPRQTPLGGHVTVAPTQRPASRSLRHPLAPQMPSRQNQCDAGHPRQGRTQAMTRRAVGLALIGLLHGVARLSGQAPTGTITGHVADASTGRPVVGVRVAVVGLDRGTVTR